MRKRLGLALGLLLVAGIAVVGWVAIPGPGEPVTTEAMGESQSESAMVPPVDEPAPPPPPPVPSTPPADALAELPVQEIETRTAHAVPEGGTGTIPHVTLQDRDGHPLARPAAPAAPPPSYVPSIGPGSDEVATSAPPSSYRPSAPARGAQQAALPAAPSTLSGPAQATGTVSLAIGGHTVRLYGVLPPASTDRCALGAGQPLACAEVTQAMLAARLARSASVTCQLPPGVGAADPARICLDATGVDIAGYLVGEGLAVADRHASTGYAGAESAARSYSKGLWRFR
jgi:endonuclease YncB( thermonuclease family)